MVAKAMRKDTTKIPGPWGFLSFARKVMIKKNLWSNQNSDRLCWLDLHLPKGVSTDLLYWHPRTSLSTSIFLSHVQSPHWTCKQIHQNLFIHSCQIFQLYHQPSMYRRFSLTFQEPNRRSKNFNVTMGCFEVK